MFRGFVNGFIWFIGFVNGLIGFVKGFIGFIWFYRSIRWCEISCESDDPLPKGVPLPKSHEARQNSAVRSPKVI